MPTSPARGANLQPQTGDRSAGRPHGRAAADRARAAAPSVRRPGSRPMRSTSRFDFRRHPNIHSHRLEEKPHGNSPGNKQQGHVQRFQDAVSTGDAEVISKTIDELVEPDVLIHMPLPIEATGA
jgi:hypothetical protein